MTEDDRSRPNSTTLSRRSFVAAAGAVAAGGVATVATAQDGSGDSRTLTVSLENVSDGSTLTTTAEGEQAEQPVPLSPAVYAVHTADEPIFSHGDPERDNGLEEVAEDGMPDRLVESLSRRETVVDAGAVAVPSGAQEPGPLTPGNTYEFEVDAHSGTPRHYLSLVTMFVPSNDLFYALGGPTGIPLFGAGADGEGMSGESMGDESMDGESMADESMDDQGRASTTGDVTDHVALWDAGTEINEEPGVGENQVQRQRGAGVGLVERGTVAPVAEVNGYDYPATEDVLRLQVTPSDDT